MMECHWGDDVGARLLDHNPQQQGTKDAAQQFTNALAVTYEATSAKV